MRYILYFFSTLFILVSCNEEGYIQSINGLEYKIIHKKVSKNLEYGSFFSFNIRQSYVYNHKDSTISNTIEYMPRFESLDSSIFPKVYVDIFKKAKVGDSIIIRELTDSVYKNLDLMPAQYSSGGYFYTNITILKTYKNFDEISIAKKISFEKNALKIYNHKLIEIEKKIKFSKLQIEQESKIIAHYLDINGEKYIRGKWGTFVAIHEKGSGDTISYKNVISIQYIGKLFSTGKIFDTNNDNTYNHYGAFEITMSDLGGVIVGLTDGLSKLQKGSSATIYLPSPLAYGRLGKPGKILPDEIIIYDVKVLNVITELEAIDIMNQNRKIKDDSIINVN